MLTSEDVKFTERPGSRTTRRATALVRGHQAFTALLLYVLVALIFERHVLGHLNSACACIAGSSNPLVFAVPTAFMWALVWWPHAILHAQDPLVSHVIWTPVGLDLARVTSVPLAALVATPVTFLWSPLVAYNVLNIVAPALGAFAAYRLCLYLTRAQAPSILAGYLYGYSTYELSHLLGLLHTVFIFAPPAVALLTLKRLDGSISVCRYVVLTALLLIAQLLLSTEIFATLTCMAAVSLLAGWIFSPPEVRTRIVRLLAPLAGAYAVTVIVCSPYLYEALANGPVVQGGGYNTDPLNFVIPTTITWLGGHALTSISLKYPGNFVEDGAYLGLPLIAIFVLFAIQSWRTVAGRILLTVAAFAALWALGPQLSIAGRRPFTLPAVVFNHLPVLEQVLPVRITLYIALAASVAAAYWLASPTRHLAYQWGLAALAVVFLIPNAGDVQPGKDHVVQPSLFTTNLYRRYLRRNEIILPLPFGYAGVSLLWQAQTHMYFRMASGHFGAPPSAYANQLIVGQLLANAPGPLARQELRFFIIGHHVSAIVADAAYSQPWLPVLTRLGLHPVRAGGLLVYDVPASWTHT